MLESDDPRWCNAWNFGPLPGNEIPVRRLVELFLQTWGEGSWRDASRPDQPHEAGALRLSIDKAIGQLDWRPRWNVAEAVRRTAQWYRRYHNSPNANMRAACCEEIDLYGHA